MSEQPQDTDHRVRRIAKRFRGFLPVAVDVETAGFEARTDALLEIAAVIITVDESGRLRTGATHAAHVEPFEGANLDPRALEFTGIDPFHPFRFAVPERKALETIFAEVDQAVKAHGCSRAILVGHNPWFDLGFLKAACARNKIKRTPFHAFSTFDTATLGGLAYGQTVLARAAMAAGLAWDPDQAHSALYDAERTAELFCTIVNSWDSRAPAPPPAAPPATD
ncbi:ribonuclease T [Ectothiorhodospiraceae bacterium 2226]|nr:ribonuclease T [Ectothiorhodospiraceae bacterium 2226]